MFSYTGPGDIVLELTKLSVVIKCTSVSIGPFHIVSPFFQAPETGSYILYLSGSDECALYLSTDEKAENKNRIVFLPKGIKTKKEEWDK